MPGPDYMYYKGQFMQSTESSDKYFSQNVLLRGKE